MIKYLMIIVLTLVTISCSLQKNNHAENVSDFGCNGCIEMSEEYWVNSEVTRYEVQESEYLPDTLITISGFIFDKINTGDTIHDDIAPFADIDYKTINEELYTRKSADINGCYTMQLMPGVYDFVVHCFGYNTLKINHVLVKKNTNVKLDITLGEGYANNIFYMHCKDRKIYKVEE